MDFITKEYQEINVKHIRIECNEISNKNQEIGFLTYNEEILLIQTPYFKSSNRFCKHNAFLESLILQNLSLDHVNDEQHEFIKKIIEIENMINTSEFIQTYIRNKDCVFISCISKNKLLHMKLKYTFNIRKISPKFIIYEKVNGYNNICEINEKQDVNKNLDNKDYQAIVKINIRTKSFLNKIYYGIELLVVKIRYHNN
jgi:hypothetical protein